jgi:putative MATE family efflux protein
MWHFIRDREFYHILFRLALPITIQNLVASSLNMVDTVMIGQLGSTELVAVGLANQIFFLFVLLLFGINSGAAIFTAQFWGKKDVANIRRVLGLALLSGSLAALIFTVLAAFFPEHVLGLFMDKRDVLLLSSQYLKIVALSYVITACTFSFSFVSRSLGQVRLPMFVSIISLGFNTVGNYILIFGHFGLQPMGVKGAAIATVIARSLELFMLIFFIYRSNNALAGRLKELFDLSIPFARRFFNTSLTVILNEFVWALGMVMYSAAYARMGESSFAAIQMTLPIQNISMVLFLGMASACSVMLGNHIGADQKEDAFRTAKSIAILGVILGLGMTLVLIPTSRLLVSGYNVPHELKDLAVKIIIVFALFFSAKMFNLINVVGILRSGGDTKFTLIMDSCGVWLLGVPLAFLGALVWKLPVYWVVALVSTEEIVKAVFGLKRMNSKIWVRDIVSQLNLTANHPGSLVKTPGSGIKPG